MADKKFDPLDVEALEKSLNDSATRVSTIWISFLIFGLYLVIAAGTVTHRQLLLEDPVKLPVLDIDLPLVGFFFLAPILYVIFHAYVLLQVLLLGRAAAAYNEAVEKADLDAEESASIRQRLANTLFAQLFAGSPRERDGWLGLLLKAMAWLTLAIAPVLILLVFQYKFLPYHSHLATWTHRVLILVEFGVVFLLWPIALDPNRETEWLKVIRSPYALASIALFGFLSLSLFTFPGEPHVNFVAGEPLDSVQCRRWFDVPDRGLPLIRFDRLYLPLVDVVDDEKLSVIQANTKNVGDLQGERTRVFRERDLNCGDFSTYSDLRAVDFGRASLRGASFWSAKLQGASFWGAQLQGASLDGADLSTASLEQVGLQGADFNNSAMEGAKLSAVYVWRSNTARCQNARVSGQLSDALLPIIKHDDSFELVRLVVRGTVPATSDNIAKFIEDSVSGIPDPEVKKTAVNRMRSGLIVDPAKDDTTSIEDTWRSCEGMSHNVSQADFDKKTATFLRALFCDAEQHYLKGSANAIAKGIIRNWISDKEDRRDFSAQLARGLLSESCAATEHLDDGDKKRLRAAALADQFTTPAPAP
ncbi:MAG: pentapeptide repeat-containing protein [Candidatus Binatia bacterium]